MSAVPKVFISYAWESQDHQNRVLALADSLEVNGVEVIFDQYDPNPTLPWPQWMEKGLREADFVLCVCTPAYKRRIDQEEPAGIGLGLQWEGQVIYNNIAAHKDHANKYQVVQFGEQLLDAIPSPLCGYNRHVLSVFDLDDTGFESLYRIVTNQPKVMRPTRGQLKVLSSVERTVIPRSGVDLQDTRIEIVAPKPKSIIQVDSDIPPSKRKLVPQHGKGSFLQRLSMRAFYLASDASANDDYTEAVSLALRALELDSTNTRCADVLSTSYFILQDYRKALHWLPVAIKKNPSDLRRRFRFILSKHFLGEEAEPTKQALSVYNSVETDSHAISALASFYSDLGDNASAIKAIESSEMKFRPDLLAQLAVYYWFDKQTQKAVDLLESVPKDTFSVTDWSNLGVGRAEIGRFGLAIEALNEAMAMNRNYQFAYYALAQIYALMGEAEPAINHLRELLVVKSIHLRRLTTERTFEAIRNTSLYTEFLGELKGTVGDAFL